MEPASPVQALAQHEPLLVQLWGRVLVPVPCTTLQSHVPPGCREVGRGKSSGARDVGRAWEGGTAGVGVRLVG